MRDTHPLASLTKVSYEDILKHPIIMPDIGERAIETFQQNIKRDLYKLNFKCIISDPDEVLALVEETKYVTFMPKLYLRNHPTLVARPIVGLEQQLMSNAHWMQDVPKKRAAQLFLDIIRDEVVPYISVAEESQGIFTPQPR